MKCLVSVLLLLGLSFPNALPLQAKGLDKLQPDTEEDDDKDNDGDGDKDSKDEKGIIDRGGKVGPPGAAPLAPAAVPSDGKAVDGKAVATKKVAPKVPEVPIEPGFQNWYLGTSLSYINVDGPEGDWHSSATGDLELGYRVLKKYLDAYDLYASIRYRPADITVELENRAYRGVLESYLVGVKGQRELIPNLFVVASAEAGLARTSVSAIDGIQKVDGSLEKSGVDLVIGAGVSYLVLEKLALGSQLHLGAGSHKTIQLGLDIRFLL